MSVWLTIPSKRPPEEAGRVLKLWRERGYKIALWRDEIPNFACDFWTSGGPNYPGYAKAVNALIEDLVKEYSDAEWFIAAGDDVEPDPNHSAEEIAAQCADHFEGMFNESAKLCQGWSSEERARIHLDRAISKTLGVMQPTGDRWGEDRNSHAYRPHLTRGCCVQCGMFEDAPGHLVGAYIDRVCGSAWIGREFATRMYHGNGPLWPEYTHMFVDEELQLVAQKMGVLWQRPDLTQYHDHWGRPRAGEKVGNADRMPEFLKAANSPGQWQHAKDILTKRKADGFPGSEPL